MEVAARIVIVNYYQGGRVQTELLIHHLRRTFHVIGLANVSWLISDDRDHDQAAADELAEKAFHRLQEVEAMISGGYLCDVFIRPLVETHLMSTSTITEDPETTLLGPLLSIEPMYVRASSTVDTSEGDTST
ncbi:hypothetical protein FGIG_04232 [Fasciola gigantica]|uniref:Uncharacterized protein n=1 Tax=Fasciola gigantica TaxID=46835 RepID=A0A504X9V8_FASGI|nr:hypothetical protein FGIG_04232 [Fasciola gigantica]